MVKMAKAPNKPTKSDFIRSMPNATAREICEAAAEVDISLTRSFVTAIRAMDKHRRTGRPPGRPGREGATAERERQLRNLIAEIGLARTEAILDRLRRL